MSDAAHPTPYLELGGEAVLRNLVERFYGHMDAMTETAAIRAIHPTDLAGSKYKLFKFLSGWLGGPNLYREQFGHPRLRMRHALFAIGPSKSEQWLLAMGRALNETPMDGVLRERLFQALTQTARHMINRPHRTVHPSASAEYFPCE